MKPMQCLRCDGEMNFARREKFQLGQFSFFFGDLPNLLAGAMEMEIYVCPKCGKMEFFRVAGDGFEEESLPQKACPRCGKNHDFDDPKCPFCKYDYYGQG